MKKIYAAQSLLTKTRGRAKLGTCLTLALAPIVPQPLDAQESVNEDSLEATTILANRIATDLSKTGNAITLIDPSEFEQAGVFQLDETLRYTPGVIAESTGGQLGTISSLFLRGTNTNHTHVRIDGMRISGSNISSGNFLGGAGISGLSQIEIIRGPQGALYGGDAIGGVLGLYSQKGEGEPSGQFCLEGGSHQSWRSSLSLQGQLDRFSYALNLGYQITENDLPNNDYEQFSQNLRLDYDVNDDFSLGMTVRSFQSDLRRPNYSDPAFARDADDDSQSALITFFSEFKLNDIWSTKITFGNYYEIYDSNNFSSPNSFKTRGKKRAGYWDNTLQWNERHTTVAGIVYEKTNYRYISQFFGVSEDSRNSKQYGAYIHHSWDVIDALTLNTGIRWENYDSYGDEFTFRGNVAYRIENTGTKLRASLGKGFRPPSFIELFGFGGGSNFNLRAESSRGWDIGIDQAFNDDQYQVSVTWFENRIKDRIDSVFGPPPLFLTTNFNTSGISRTRGLELAASGKWLNERLKADLNYTWLDETLSGQPEHSAGLRIDAKLTDKLDAGIGATYRDERTFGGNKLDSYIVANLHANYQINDSLTLHTRVENLFDKDYELASFGSGAFRSVFPARGRGLFAGLTYRW